MKTVATAFFIFLLTVMCLFPLENRSIHSCSGIGAENELSLPSESRLRSNETGWCSGTGERQTGIAKHRLSVSDVERLKERIGSWKASENHSQIINGHGTGWRSPTEEEWAHMIDNGYIVERIPSYETLQTPSFVDHTAKPWFPPIGDQDGEGSCTSWAVGYYMKTFQEAKEHNWDLSGATWSGGQPSVEYLDRIISPDFIYHLTNGGVDEGSWPKTAINLICSIGASSWEKMPYNPSDHASWPSEEAWREAPMYRGNSSGWQYMYLNMDDGLESLKNWIASDNLAEIVVDGYKYSQLTANDVWTLDNYANPSLNHANTIVGYDDSLAYIESGQTRYGAFKVVNSWGVGGWENVPDGCYWISYEAMKQRVGSCEFYYDRTGYEPELAASFRITHSKRGECSITVGVGSQTKSFSQYISGGDQPFCSNNILFDITEFKEAIPNLYGQQFFLEVYDGGSSTTGTIMRFAIEYAESTDPPISTINGVGVCAYVTLSSARVRISPEVTHLGYVGQTFNVSFAVEGAFDLYGLDIRVSWDTSWIRLVSRTKTIPVESYPGGILHSPTLPIKDIVDETGNIPDAPPGTMYWLAEVSMLPAAAFAGNGQVAWVTFRVVKQPTLADGSIRTFIYMQSDLASPSGLPISHTIVNGAVDISPPSPTIVRVIPEISQFEPSYVVGQNLTVTVAIENTYDLYGFDLQFAWNNTYLEYLSHTKMVPVESFPGGVLHPPIIPVKDVVSETGNIPDADPRTMYWLAECSMSPAAPFMGNGTAFSMTFRIRKQSSVDVEVPLYFISADLASSTGIPIPCVLAQGVVRIPKLVRDVAIIDIKPSKTIVGQSMTLNVSFANQGYVSEAVGITVYANETVIASLAGVNLQNGAIARVAFTWNTTEWNKGNYTLKAVATPVQDETDIQDNTKNCSSSIRVTILGDVDGDFDVDIFDVVKITSCYGKKRGDTSYNPNADIDDNDMISILDVVSCTGHYGQKYP